MCLNCGWKQFQRWWSSQLWCTTWAVAKKKRDLNPNLHDAGAVLCHHSWQILTKVRRSFLWAKFKGQFRCRLELRGTCCYYRCCFVQGCMQTGLIDLFSIADFVFQIDHVTIPRSVFSFKVGHFHARVQSFKCIRQRLKPPRYRHMVCFGKTKSTSEKGLVDQCSGEWLVSLVFVSKPLTSLATTIPLKIFFSYIFW